MRISINANKIDGPYGGGNQFANALEKYLSAKGHEIFRTLVSNIDVILIVSSKTHPVTTSYTIEEISEYTKLNPNTIVVQRINTCDEQRGRDLGINRALLDANRLADYTVFVSSFIQELYKKHGMDMSKPYGIILNSADEEIFNPMGSAEWDGKEKLKIVTHHWSTNYMKGFDIYERLDQLLDISPFKDLFEFTYIGNIPLGVDFKNTQVIPPLYGPELASAIKQHHIYLTAARHEPGGNHYVEAMQCGLPVLFLRSGSLPEYCAPYGVEFTLVNFEEKLLEIREKYKELRQRVLKCPYSATRMTSQYEDLFKKLVIERRKNPRPAPSWNIKILYKIQSCQRKIFGIKTLLRGILCG